MHVKDAQSEVRRVYLGGLIGNTISGALGLPPLGILGGLVICRAQSYRVPLLVLDTFRRSDS